MPDHTIPFLQSPAGAIRVAMETLFENGIYSLEDGFKEVRVVRDEDHFHVHLLGSSEGSFLISVPRRRRVTRYECELHYLEATKLQLVGGL